jgi:uncharacterized protein Yka (UPF0111/DUF47 family)
MAIAAVTGGRFSHAAIWLPRVEIKAHLTGIWQLELFESEDSGIGQTSLPKILFTEHNGTDELGVLLPNTADAALYRHPTTEVIKPKLLEEAANRLREKEQYLGYSELDRLAQAANKTPWLKPYIVSFLRSHDNRDISLIPGSFCSELVAKYFEELELPLFHSHRSTDTVAPNDLSDSLLKEVEGAISSMSQLREVRHIRSIGPGRKEFLPAMVRFRSRSIQVARQVEEMEATLSQDRGDTLTMQSAMLSSEVRQAVKKAEAAERHGDSIMAERLSVTVEACLMALAICHEVIKRRSQPTLPGKAWANAEARLVHEVTKLSSESGRNLSRQSALVDIRLARSLHRSENTKESGARLLKIRRTSLNSWIRQRDLDDQMRPVFAKVEETFFEDAEMEAIIEDVLESAIGLLHQSSSISAQEDAHDPLT